MSFPWVVNEQKYHRAVKEVKTSGKEVTEEAVKAVYVRLLGLVREEPKVLEEETEEVEEAAPRRGRPSSK